MAETKSYHRQVACKARVCDIVRMKLDESNISRVNIIATVVHKPEGSSNYGDAVIDDGTGRISLRSFENKDYLSNVEVGDAALVIGKIREFNDERYIVPEILKKMGNLGWMNVRNIELGKTETVTAEAKADSKEVDEGAEAHGEVYSTIKSLDSGDGASIEEVIKKCATPGAESEINELLKRGNVFEIRPGRIKVLE